MRTSKTREITFIYHEQLDEVELLSTTYKKNWVALWALLTLLHLRKKKSDIVLEPDGIYRIEFYGTLTKVYTTYYRLD